MILKFPVVKDSKIKTCCYATLELLKLSLNYLKININNALQKEPIKNPFLKKMY